MPYSLQPGICNVSVRLKHITEVEGLDPVHGPTVGPAEGRFQAAAIERTRIGGSVLINISIEGI